jgi:hypothetical protein
METSSARTIQSTRELAPSANASCKSGAGPAAGCRQHGEREALEAEESGEWL